MLRAHRDEKTGKTNYFVLSTTEMSGVTSPNSEENRDQTRNNVNRETKSRTTQGRQHLGQGVDLTLLNLFDILASIFPPITGKISGTRGGITT